MEQQFQQLNESLRKLLKQHAALKKENVALQKRVKELQDNIEKSEAEQPLQNVDISKFNDDQRAYLQEQIDTYLAEIDKCIVLLNTQ